MITQHCHRVQDLVIQIWEDDLPRLAALLCQLPQLETLHILASASSETSLGEREIQWIAQVCTDANRERRAQRRGRHLQRVSSDGMPAEGSGLHQIGFRNRVWLVEREFGATKEPIHNASADQTQADQQGSSSFLANVSRTDAGNVTASLDDEEPIHVTLKRWDPAAGTFPEVLLVVRS